MHFPQTEHPYPADTPLGMLQRGRGAGWREAAASGNGHELLLACLAHEPRWDRQVESRADYYASLALQLSVPASAIATRVCNDDDLWIVEEVIEEMARRGSAEATAVRHTFPRDEEFEDWIASTPRPGHPARSRLSYADGRGAVATSVFAEHAQVADAPALRSALAAADDYYAISSLAEALGRLPEAGPFLELDEVYVHSAYSYARARAVQAMAVTDPAFADKWAAECLWDCEESIRIQGILFAPMERAALERVRDLSEDEFEDPEVRQAARSRLRDAPSPAR